MNDAATHQALEKFTYGVYAVTVHGSGDRVTGFTASWVMQCSFQPPLVAVAVENGSVPLEFLEQGRHFAVNVLGPGQEEIARTLAHRTSEDPEKIRQVDYTVGSSGCPILKGALAWVECRVTGTVSSGDHTLFIGEVTGAGAGREGRPLVAAESGFSYAG